MDWKSFLNYYNSVASFEGEWYLFATDENDIYHVHPSVAAAPGDGHQGRRRF